MERIALCCVAAVAFSLGCGKSHSEVQPEALSWEAFLAEVAVEDDTGFYLFNGDEIATSEDELRAAFARYEAQFADVGEDGVATSQQPLIVNLVNGRDDKWSASAAGNLTYCVDSRSFGSNYSAVVQAMATATGAWESVARVNFAHASALDADCNARTNVVFDVRQVCRGQYLARAFFPSGNRRSHEVLVDCTSFGDIRPYTLAGVLRHELGHSIGFRHEHTRPEAGTCFEDNQWRALTAYDSASVMHYPQCNGTNRGDLLLTSLDRTGAAALYP